MHSLKFPDGNGSGNCEGFYGIFRECLEISGKVSRDFQKMPGISWNSRKVSGGFNEKTRNFREIPGNFLGIPIAFQGIP